MSMNIHTKISKHNKPRLYKDTNINTQTDKEKQTHSLARTHNHAHKHIQKYAITDTYKQINK